MTDWKTINKEITAARVDNSREERNIVMHRYSAQITLLVVLLVTMSGCALWTGKGVLPGRSQGMATITVTEHTLEEVAAAIHAVFIADRFNLKENAPRLKVYERVASMMKDLSYSGPLGEGAVERAFLQIHDEGQGVHRVECNVFIVTGSGDPFFEDRTKVLKLFAGQYRRLLRRVASRLD